MSSLSLSLPVMTLSQTTQNDALIHFLMGSVEEHINMGPLKNQKTQCKVYLKMHCFCFLVK